jgi:hypothetical protein
VIPYKEVAQHAEGRRVPPRPASTPPPDPTLRRRSPSGGRSRHQPAPCLLAWRRPCRRIWPGGGACRQLGLLGWVWMGIWGGFSNGDPFVWVATGLEHTGWARVGNHISGLGRVGRKDRDRIDLGTSRCPQLASSFRPQEMWHSLWFLYIWYVWYCCWLYLYLLIWNKFVGAECSPDTN